MEAHASDNMSKGAVKRYRRAELDEEEDKQKMLVEEDGYAKSLKQQVCA
jgi:hypothetical protein